MTKIAFYCSIVLLFLTSSVYSAPIKNLALPSESTTEFKITGKRSDGFTAVNTISTVGLNSISTESGNFSNLELKGYARGGALGTPQLPELNTLIEIPQKAKVRITVTGLTEELVDLRTEGNDLKLMPHQPSIPKNSNPGDIPFKLDKAAYRKNGFGSVDKVRVEILGNMRGVRLARLTVSPFSYNPAKNTLKVATRMSFNVSFTGSDSKTTTRMKKTYYSPAFKSAFSSVVNYSPSSSDTSKDVIIDSATYPLTYVVVASDSFLATQSLKNFIAWKETSGYHVIQASTNSIFGASTTATDKRIKLKNYLQALYDGGTYAPSYVLLVGDVSQIPAWTGDDSKSATDLYYCTFDSGYLPDAYYGRFPVENSTELSNVVEKTLQYEQYTMGTGAYLDKGLLISGADPDFAPTYGNGQAAYLLNVYFKQSSGFSQLYAYLFDTDWTWADTTMGSVGSSSAPLATSQISSTISSGVGIANYNGHCSSDGWYNKVYGVFEFETADIASLTNTDKYGFIVGNCCESSKFDEDDSFGETLVLASQKGAVAYVGASANTFWDEDFYWAVGYKDGLSTLTPTEARNLNYTNTGHGSFDALWHTHAETDENWYITAAQMVYIGDLTVMKYVPGNGKYYFEAYNVIGDPSLTPYLAEPSSFSTPSDNGPIYPCITTSLRVSTEQYTLVALSKNGEYVASGFSGSSGVVNLTFSPFSNGDTAQLLLTRQNRKPKTFTVDIASSSGELPTASFVLTGTSVGDPTPIEVTSGVPVSFTNLSTGCPDTYAWVFDGASPASSTALSPTVTYSVLGIHDVSLTVTNGKGPGTLTRSGYIKVVPGINFQADHSQICYGTTIQFTDKSTNSPTAWSWTFDGGTPSTSTEQNPSVTYNTIGTYSVGLNVTIDGQLYSLTKDNYINVTTLKPVAAFVSDTTTIDPGQSITFTDQSDNTPTQLNWRFFGGTPSTSTALNPTITYNKSGRFAVILTASNSGGSSTVTKYITVTGDVTDSPNESKGGGGGCFISSLSR